MADARGPARTESDSFDGERHALWIELFFDLVFVVAVAQLDEGFLEDPTVTRALVLVGLFVPVWWAWVGVAFYATRFAADELGFRLLLLVEMAASLALAASIPAAFSGHTVDFALSYGAVRLTLVALYLRSLKGARPAERALIRVLAGGFAVGAVLWLVSALVPAPARYAVWALALAVDLGAPLLRGGNLAAVPINPTHLPERFGTFVIIVLGEAVATTGQSLAHIAWSTATLLRAVGCFVVACAIWWVYFDRAELRIRAELGQRESSSTTARDVYSYGHFPVVVGITFAAAGARLVIGGGEDAAGAGIVSLCLGVAAVLLALALIDLALHGRRTERAAWTRALAAAGLIVLAALHGVLPTAAALWAAAAVSMVAILGNSILGSATPQES